MMSCATCLLLLVKCSFSHSTPLLRAFFHISSVRKVSRWRLGHFFLTSPLWSAITTPHRVYPPSSPPTPFRGRAVEHVGDPVSELILFPSLLYLGSAFFSTSPSRIFSHQLFLSSRWVPVFGSSSNFTSPLIACLPLRPIIDVSSFDCQFMI